MTSIEYKISTELQPYPDAIKAMEARVEGIISGESNELLWFLEHQHCYTGGTSAKVSGLLSPQFPVYETGRGGEYTYHGPGQRVVYPILDLKTRQKRAVPDVRRYVHDLEEWIINTLSDFDIKGERRQGRVGIWVVDKNKKESKIAALGIRIRKGIAFHGISINVNPDLTHYNGIIPCGIKEYGVTSMCALGKKVTLTALDQSLKEHFPF